MRKQSNANLDKSPVGKKNNKIMHNEINIIKSIKCFSNCSGNWAVCKRKSSLKSWHMVLFSRENDTFVSLRNCFNSPHLISGAKTLTKATDC